MGSFAATPGAGQVVLAWTNPGTGDFDHVNVYRATSRYGTPTLLQAVASPATTWTDTTAVNGVDYFYSARAATAANVEAPAVTTGGLLGTWYTTQAMTTIAGQRIEPKIDYANSSNNNPFGQSTSFGTRWEGWVDAAFAETYTFYGAKDDGIRIWVDGVLLVDSWSCCGEPSGAIGLSAGWHALRVDFQQATGPWQAQVSWSSPSLPKEIIPSASLGTEARIAATPRNAAVTVTAPNGGGTITAQTPITWTASGAVDHWEIDLSSDSGASWAPLAGWVPGASTSWTWDPPIDTTGSTYRVRVRAVSAGGTVMASDASDADFAINTPPAPPISNLQAFPGVGQVVLTWTNPVATNFDHVQVLRSTQEGDPGVVVHTTAGPAVDTWTDTTVTNGTRYFYRVRSVTPTGITGPTIAPGSYTGSYYLENGATEFNELVATRGETVPLDRNTTNPAVWPYDSTTEGYDATTPTARWDGWFFIDATDTWRFNINHRYAKHRLWIDGALAIDGWTAWHWGATSSTTRNLAPGWHQFRMEAKEMCSCNSAYVHLLRATSTGTFQTIPMTQMGREYWVSAIPTTTNVTVTSPNGGEAYLRSGDVTTTWTAAGPDATRADIWLSLDGGATFPHLLGKAVPNTGSWTWTVPTGLSSTQARVKVVAETNGGLVVDTDVSDADFTIDSTGGTLASVTNLQAVANGPGQVDVSWTMPAPLGAIDHVNIYRSTGDGSEPVLVHSTSDNVTTSWSDTGRTDGERYEYFVRTVAATGQENRTYVPGSLRAEYFSDSGLSMFEASQQLTGAFDLTFPYEGFVLDETHGRTYGGGFMGARWTGAMYIATPGTYTVYMYTRHDHRRLWIDGRQLVNGWTGGWVPGDATATLYLTQGWHTLRVEQGAIAGDYLRSRIMLAPRGAGATALQPANMAREQSASAVAHGSSITVTSPNGGETWRNFGARTITWNATAGDITSVNVKLSLDGGATFPHFLARRVPQTGSWEWIVPAGMSSSQARFRVEGVSAGGRVLVRDDSDANVTISAAGGTMTPITDLTATATAPGQVTLAWTMPTPLGAIDHVNIYREPGEGQEPVLVHSTANATTTTWVDTGLASGTRYRYMARVADASGAELRSYVPGALDVSYFSDLGLTTWEGSELMSSTFDLTFPYDGPILDSTHGRVFAGSNVAARWSGAFYVATGDTYTLLMYTRHDHRRLWIDGRQVLNGWTGGWTPGDAGTTMYLAPGWHTLRMEQAAVPGDYLRTRLTWNVRSGAVNAIPAPSLGRERTASVVTSATSLTVTSPNGGEQVRRQGARTISWSNLGGDASHVTIRLSLDGGATWPHVVARRVPNTGSYEWYVPGGMLSNQARIRVEGNAGLGFVVASDTSDADFTIDSSGSALAPVGGLSARANAPGQVLVSWTMPSPLGAVDHVNVYRHVTNSSEPVLVHTTADASVTSWTDTAVVDGARYSYVVRTADVAGREARSYEVGAFDYTQWRDQSYSAFDHAGTHSGTFDLTLPYTGLSSPQAPGSNCEGCAMRWTGGIYVGTGDTYSLYMYSRHAYRRMWLDGELLVNEWTGAWSPADVRVTKYLAPGWHSVYLEEAAPPGDYIRARLQWGVRNGAVTPITGTSIGRERSASAVATAASVTLTSPNGGEVWTGNANRTVTWSALNAPPGSTARVGYSTDGGATWPYTIAGDISGSSFSFKPPESLNSSTVRMYVEIVAPDGHVRARDESDADLTIDASVTNTAVTNLVATPGWQQVSLSWTNPTDASFDHVNIYRSTTPQSIGVKVATIAKPASSWVNTGLTNGTAYHYVVRAADSADVERISIVSGGLRGYYYSTGNFGTLATSQIDPTISFDWGWGGGPAALGGQADNFSIRWVGYVRSTATTDWRFDGNPTRDAMRVTVNGQRLINAWNGCDCDVGGTAHQQLTDGWHPIDVEYMETNGYARAYLHWWSNGGQTRVVVPATALGTERTAVATPADITPPTPNPVGAVTADSPTQITWDALGSDDADSGLHASAYSYDSGTSWTNQVTYVRSGLVPNTQYTQTVRVRDAVGNMTNPRVLTTRTLAVDPSVSSSHATGTWLGPGATTITFSNLAAFGAGGVQHYRWVFNQNVAHTFDGSEPQWSTGNLVRTVSTSGDWYLHVRSYNADDVGGATTSYGPFRIDATAPDPNPPTVGWASTLTDVNFSIGAITDSESGVPTDAYSWDGGTTWGSSATSSSTGLSPNTSVTRSVRTRDVLGNVSALVTVTGATLPVDPNVSVSPASGPTWYAANTTFTMTSAAPFGPGSLSSYRYRLTTNPTDAVTTADPAWSSGTQGVPIATTGTWYVRVRSYNAVGDGGNTITLGPLNVDGTAPPATTVSAPSPTAGAPVLSWTAVTDGESGVAGYKVYRSTASGALGSLLATAGAAATSWTDGGALVDDTTYWYTVQPIDAAGNEQVVGNNQVAVVYASAPPSGSSVSIASGASAVASPNVTLTLASTNAVSMQLSNAPDFSGASWEPFAATAGWTLSAGSGTKTVYARFRNAGGTVSASVADNILLDQAAPLPDPPGVVATANSATQATWTSDPASDAGVGLPAAPYSFDDGNTWQAGVSLVRAGLAPNTTYSALVRVRDALGNATGQRAASVTTLPAAPAVTGSPLPDPGAQPRGTTFTFTNAAGWGAGGVEYYRYAWSNAATHTFAGTEAMWTSGTLPIQELDAGTFYLHVLAYNSEDQAGSTLDYGPFNVAAPQTPADLTVNIADTQTLSCNRTDFSVALLPGTQDDATVACTVSSAVAGWNLQAHASAAPFFVDFVDMTATPAAYAAPASGDAQVGFTMTGAKSDAVFSAGSLWRGFAGGADIRIAGDTGTSAGDTVTMRVRAHLGTTATLVAGDRSATITYTLNPGA